MTQRKPRGMSFETWVGGQISQAIARGDFDGLAGAGKPLSPASLDETGYEWVLAKARKENLDVFGMLPPGLALKKEREDLPRRADELPSCARWPRTTTSGCRRSGAVRRRAGGHRYPAWPTSMPWSRTGRPPIRRRHRHPPRRRPSGVAGSAGLSRPGAAARTRSPARRPDGAVSGRRPPALLTRERVGRTVSLLGPRPLEVVMTGRRPARLLCGLAVALLLTACGGGGVTTAADDAAASAAGHVSGAATPGRGSGEQQVAPTTPATTGRGSSGDGARGNPGAPLGDPAAGGGDTQAQGNPGAPGDVAVFEEAGVPYSVLKDDANSTCAGGVCTLLAPVVGAGKPDDVGGVDQCVVRKQSDIRYDPPAQGGFFRRGAKVQATVDCAVHDSGGETTSGTTTSGTTTSGTDTSGGTQTSGGTSGSSAPGQAPAGRPQG